MELCFNEMTVMKNGALPEDIALCAQAGFSAVELRKGTLLRYLRGGGTLEALWQTLEEQHVRAASLNALESVSFQTKAGGRMLRELSEWCFAACRVLGCGCMEVIASFHVPEGTSAAAICRWMYGSASRTPDGPANQIELCRISAAGSSARICSTKRTGCAICSANDWAIAAGSPPCGAPVAPEYTGIRGRRSSTFAR